MKNCKKILSFFCLIMVMSFCIIGSVRADANSGGVTGTGIGVSGENSSALYDSGRHLFLRVKLVYYDGHKTTNIGASKGVEYFYVVNKTAAYFYDYSSFNKNHYQVYNTDDPNFNWITYDGSKHFDFEEFERDTVGSNSYSSEEQYKYFKKYLDIFKLKREDLKKESCNVHEKGQGNCSGKKGYRLIAELMTIRGSGEEVSMKDYAEECEKGLRSCISEIRNGSVFNYSKEMHIRWQDVNYYCPSGNCYADKEVPCLADKNCGWGIWIVDLSGITQQNHDFSLDSACVNCDASSKSGASYIIQDVDNWKLLKEVNVLDNKGNNQNIKNYFTKDRVAGHICREQYQIYFPTSSKITVERGSYFTINEAAGFPNFEPFRVERVIQCIKEDGTKGDLSAVKNKYCKNNSNGNSGNIKIWYNELPGIGYDNYSLNWTDMRKVDKDCSATQSGDVAMVSISSNYKLKEDTYKYIRNGTNKPILSGNGISSSELKNNYTATLVPNLPVALNHKVSKNNTVGGHISLQFEFPSNSNMKKAFEDLENQYLKTEGQTTPDDANIYKQWKEDSSKVENDELTSISIKNSACSKMFGFKTSKFEKCVKERASVKAKIEKCRTLNSATINASSTSKDGYTCPIYMDPDGDDSKCTQATVGKKGPGYDYTGYTWEKMSDGKYGCCSSSDKASGKCGGGGDDPKCTQATVGKKGPGYDYTDYTWEKMSDGNYGCCSSSDKASGKCSGKTYCEDGVNGVCGETAKLCLCTVDNLCPEDHLNKTCPPPPPPGGGKCSKEGGKYYIEGKEVSKTQYGVVCCDESNHSEFNRDWNPKGYCCDTDEQYNPATGTCAPPDACKECSDASLCCLAGHKYKCGVKDIDGKLVCDDGKVEDPEKELIYRTIDLGTPFVGENGDFRNTGSNWSYKSSDGTNSNNSYNNSLVKAVINENEDVYNENHVLYRFTLDSDNISEIRKYNSSQKSEGGYSDFTLKCNNGNNCKSEFIRDKKYTGDYSGICMSSNTNSNEYKKYCK